MCSISILSAVHWVSCGWPRAQPVGSAYCIFSIIKRGFAGCRAGLSANANVWMHRCRRGITAALLRCFARDPEALDATPLATIGDLPPRAVSALKSIPAGIDQHSKLAMREWPSKWGALGSNPWALVMRCHRVIAKDGGLQGCAGGLHRQR